MSSRIIGQTNFNITPNPRQIGGNFDDISVVKLTSDDIAVDTVTDKTAGIVSILPPPTGTTQPVKAATTAPGNLNTDYIPGNLVDGYTLKQDDRILLKNQVDPIENGIYVVQAAGAPLRADDYAVGQSVSGLFTIIQGGTQSSTGFINTTLPGNDIVGTNVLPFDQATIGPGGVFPVINAGTVNTTTLNATDINSTGTTTTNILNSTTINTTDITALGISALTTVNSTNVNTTNINVTGTVTLPNASITHAMMAPGSVTLTSAGGIETLVNTSAGPDMLTKGLTAGTHLSLVSTPTDITINAATQSTSLVDDPASTTGAGTASIVSTNPPPVGTAYVRRIVQGASIVVTEVGQDVVIAGAAAAVTLASEAGAGNTTIVTDGVGPALVVKATHDSPFLNDTSDATTIRFDNILIRLTDLAGNQPPTGNAASLVGSIGSVVIGAAASANAASSSVAIGRAASVTAGGAIAIGSTSNSLNTDTIAIGGLSLAQSGTGAIAIGRSSSAINAFAVSLGYQADSDNEGVSVGHLAATGVRGIAIGANSIGTGVRAIAVGQASNAGGTDTLAVGRGASAFVQDTVAIGRTATATGGIASIAIGAGASSAAQQAISLGNNASSANLRGIAIGNAASVTGDYGVAVGWTAICAGLQGVSIGRGASSTTNSAAFGIGADAGGTYSACLGPFTTSSATRSITVGVNSSGTSANLDNVIVDSVYIASKNGATPNFSLLASTNTFTAFNTPFFRNRITLDGSGADPINLSVDNITMGHIVITNGATNNVNMPTAAAVWGTQFSNAAMNVWKVGNASATSGSGSWFIIDNKSGGGINFNGGADWELLNHSAGVVAAPFSVSLPTFTHIFTWHRGSAGGAGLGLVAHVGRIDNANL